jgi:catechol 2,3-dioxygenase
MNTMRVERIGHLQLPVRDLQGSLRFYRDLLGLKQIPVELPPGAAMLSAGPTHHEFLLAELPADAMADGRLKYRFGFQIGDTVEALRAAKAELLTAGAAILGSGQTTATKSLYVSDPDGNEIELYIDEPPESGSGQPDALSHPIFPLPL